MDQTSLPPGTLVRVDHGACGFTYATVEDAIGPHWVWVRWHYTRAARMLPWAKDLAVRSQLKHADLALVEGV